MKTREDIRSNIAKLLRDLRESTGLSKSQISTILNVDPHTYTKYENGESPISAEDLIWLFAELEKDVLRHVLDMIYPNVYEGLSAQSDIDDLREGINHFMGHVASERFVRSWDYITFGNHGSDVEPQLQEFLMICHLPLAYRYVLAENVWMFWQLAVSKDKLTNTDCTMPNIEMFLNTLETVQKAVVENKDGYTTVMER